MKPQYRVVVITALSALALAALSPTHAYPSNWTETVALSALCMVLSQLAISLKPDVSFLLDTSVVVAAYLLQGPIAAGVAMASSISLLTYVRERTPASAVVFNAAQHFVSATAAGLFVLAADVGGGWAFPPSSPHHAVASAASSAIVFVLVMHAINLTLVAVYIKYREKIRIVEVLRGIRPLADVPANVLLALVGVVLADLIAADSWVGAMLVLLPILAVRKVFRVYSEMAATYSDLISTLMGALEEKDPYTRGHSDRVASYCRLVGQEMGLSTRDAVLLERAALLHDIGKMAVPEAVLRSAQRLTGEEVEMVRRHPEIGHRILCRVELLEPLLPLIRRHHERPDGAGYPEGLGQADIPLSVRILSVADAYDAMTSDRPYRSRLSEQRALDELMKGCGTQFDPHVVRSLVTALHRRASLLASTAHDDTASCASDCSS